MDFGSSSHDYGYMGTNAQINNDGVNANVADSHVQEPVINQAQYNHLLSLLQQDATGAKMGDKEVEHVANQATILHVDFNTSKDQIATGLVKHRKFFSKHWIVDSGATNHICFDLSLMFLH